MAISVTDAFSNRTAHVQEAADILGSSSQKWAVFQAIYKGKKKRKTVVEIAKATGLNSFQVLNVGGPLARAGLFLQEGRSPTVYVKIDEISHIRDRIVARKTSPRQISASLKSNSASIGRPAHKPAPRTPAKRPNKKAIAHDVFISHAREDKSIFVKDLAERIKAAGITVWYDEFSLKWGDKLREKIDQGLLGSRFGIVVLSPDFLRKKWTKEELNGLFELETAGQTRILPIWHNLTRQEVLEFSPTLAGRLSLDSSHPIDDLIDQLKDLLGK